MANATKGIAKVIKEEGRFQNDPADSGNFYKGKNYGTKFGITPQAFVSHYGSIQPDSIKNLSVEQAIPIYKKRYWDKIQGDHIKNDSIADLIMFIVVNSGTGMVSSVKQVMNETAGKKIVVVNQNPLTSQEITVLNNLPGEVFFNRLKKFRETFYRALVQRKPEKAKFLKGWLSRLSQHVYVPGPNDQASNTDNTTELLLGFGFGLLLFGLLK